MSRMRAPGRRARRRGRTSRDSQTAASMFGPNDIAPVKPTVSSRLGTGPTAPGSNASVSTPFVTTSTRAPGTSARTAAASIGETVVTMSADRTAAASRRRATSARIAIARARAAAGRERLGVDELEQPPDRGQPDVAGHRELADMHGIERPVGQQAGDRGIEPTGRAQVHPAAELARAPAARSRPAAAPARRRAHRPGPAAGTRWTASNAEPRASRWGAGSPTTGATSVRSTSRIRGKTLAAMSSAPWRRSTDGERSTTRTFRRTRAPRRRCGPATHGRSRAAGGGRRWPRGTTASSGSAVRDPGAWRRRRPRAAMAAATSARSGASHPSRSAETSVSPSDSCRRRRRSKSTRWSGSRSPASSAAALSQSTRPVTVPASSTSTFAAHRSPWIQPPTGAGSVASDARADSRSPSRAPDELPPDEASRRSRARRASVDPGLAGVVGAASRRRPRRAARADGDGAEPSRAPRHRAPGPRRSGADPAGRPPPCTASHRGRRRRAARG